VIRVQAVIVHLLLFVIERISVDPTRILLLLAVTKVGLGLGPPQVILVAIAVSFEAPGIIFESLSESFLHFLVNLVAHVIQAGIGIIVVVCLRAS
jgi:hypothetical protein